MLCLTRLQIFEILNFEADWKTRYDRVIDHVVKSMNVAENDQAHIKNIKIRVRKECSKIRERFSKYRRVVNRFKVKEDK